MKICGKAILSTALLLAVGLAIPGPSSGQPMDLDTPPGSPLWWTLTDEISPMELRTALRDPEAHLARYLAAIEAGVADVLPEDQVQTLSFYYNRDLTPELTPMWVAFSAFASGH
ncbi:MAG TPA: hypothetical protein VLF66_11105, partial [Thermoanaerobaculia bacterium]|nr:hypothetical protein [Thermoanaerobaculia bacterium]